jgi:hypothetical protein
MYKEKALMNLKLKKKLAQKKGVHKVSKTKLSRY